MADTRVENIHMADGRLAERHVSDDGETKIVEIHAEPKRNKHLEHRVIEKRKPFVYERTTHEVDPDSGQIMKEVVEALDDPETRMQMVHSLGLARDINVEALRKKSKDSSVSREEMMEAIVAAVKAARCCDDDEEEVQAFSVETEECDECISRDEMMQAIVTAVRELKDDRVEPAPVVKAQSVQKDEDDCDCNVTREEMSEIVLEAVRSIKDQQDDVVSAQNVRHPRTGQVSALQAVTSERVDQSNKGSNNTNLVILLVIAAQLAALGYILFVM